MSNWDPIVQDIETVLRPWFAKFEIKKNEKEIWITLYKDNELASHKIDLAHYAPRDVKNKAAINKCKILIKKYAEKGIYPLTKDKFDGILKSQFSWVEKCYRSGMAKAVMYDMIATELFLQPPKQKESSSIKTIRYQFRHFKIFGHLDLKVEPS